MIDQGLAYACHVLGVMMSLLPLTNAKESNLLKGI